MYTSLANTNVHGVVYVRVDFVSVYCCAYHALLTERWRSKRGPALPPPIFGLESVVSEKPSSGVFFFWGGRVASMMRIFSLENVNVRPPPQYSGILATPPLSFSSECL